MLSGDPQPDNIDQARIEVRRSVTRHPQAKGEVGRELLIESALLRVANCDSLPIGRGPEAVSAVRDWLVDEVAVGRSRLKHHFPSMSLRIMAVTFGAALIEYLPLD